MQPKEFDQNVIMSDKWRMLPGKATDRISIRIDEALKNRLLKYMAIKGYLKAPDVVRRALVEFLEQEEKRMLS